MDNQQSYITRVSGYEIDVLPFAKDAILRCPYSHDLTALELARLIEMGERGKYINVATQERVEGRNLGWLIGDAIKEIRRITYWRDRIEQMRDPHMLWFRGHIELVTDHCWCSKADSMRGRWLDPDEIEPLPFRECDQDRCWCDYRTYSLRQLERAGREPKVHPSPIGDTA